MSAVGYYFRKEWKAPILFYSFFCSKCKRLVVNYPQSYAQHLDCPICGERIKTLNPD